MPIENNSLNSSKKFPLVIRVVSSSFKSLANVWLSFILSFLLLSWAYITDSLSGKSLFVEKVSGVVVVLGLLLTIKHNFLKNTESPLNYIQNINESLSWSSLKFETDPMYYEQAKKVAYDETTGFLLTISGTLLNCFGSFIPLLNIK